MRANVRNQRTHNVIIGVIAAVLLIALFGATLYYFEYVAGNEDKEALSGENLPVQQSLFIGEDEYQITHNLETYLLMGTDDSGNVEAEGTDEYRGQMADFLLLLVLDKTDNKYGMLQIDRNTICDVPYIGPDGNGEDTMEEQICTAHWYGANPEQGCSNTVWAVSELLGGLEIDGYYSIHMSELGKLNHAVGGVEVTFDSDLTMVDPAFKEGATVVLSDEQAEKFVRARMGVGNEDNASRMARQEQFLEGFREKAQQLMKSDPAFINDLYMALEDDAVSDIPSNRISVITNQIYKDDSWGTQKLDGETRLGHKLKDGLEHEEFYPTESSIASVMCLLCGIDEGHVIKGEDVEEDE